MMMLIFVFLCVSKLQAQNIISLDGVWKAQQTSSVFSDGNALTQADATLPSNWLDAKVPGTILSVLLENKIIKDPFIGLNNKAITDMFISGREYYTYWFYREFESPEYKDDKTVWLKFRGLNYLADIFVNGQRVNTSTHEGMFLREKYNITPYLYRKKKNKIAVLVQPVTYPGNAAMGQAGDGEIARNVARQFTAGWDWVCNIPDRNTGIWDKVSLEITGAIDIKNGYVCSEVPNKRSPKGLQEPAYIYPTAEVVNATGELQKTTVSFSWKKGELLQKKVELLPYQTKTIDFGKIQVNNPQLWWPNGTGNQSLYEAVFMSGGDKEKFNFGIRETGSFYDEKIGARIFTINGQNIFIKGGNWIGSDALMRLSKDRYDTEVRFHAEANINMIRIWGGSMTERPEFYEACDKYGIMVWQDLFITGDGNGEWYDPKKKQSQARRKQYPDNHDLFIKSTIDQIKMLRNHPSLYLWCGGNETKPPADINDELKKNVFPVFDQTRDYLEESTGEDISVNTVTQNGDGPYGWKNPIFFFETDWLPFNPEIGSVGIPNPENLKKILDSKNLTPPVKTTNKNKTRPVFSWNYHKLLPIGKEIYAYGEIEGFKDYVKTFQVMSYQQYQSLQEGFSSRMWDYYSGILVWKTQNPWTSLRGMFYDYYLDPVGGMYGYKHAADPLHGQYDLDDKKINVINQTFETQRVNLAVTSHDLHGKILEQIQQDITIEANTTQKVFDAPVNKNDVAFLRIILTDKENIKHKNFYWVGDGSGMDHHNLDKLEKTTLTLSFKKIKNTKKYKIKINNSGIETAFFIRLKIINENNKELLLPVFYSDNYFTLFPNETEEIIIDASKLLDTQIQKGTIVAEAWNTAIGTIKIK